MRRLIVTALCGISLAFVQPAAAADFALDGYAIVDLTHALNSETIFWPTSPSGFVHTPLSYGYTEQGYFYSAYTFAMPEHGGTHLDAPIHFHEGGLAVDEIPLARLVLPAVVINIAAKAAADPDTRLSVEDVEAFEAANGNIREGAAVLVRSGWSQRWPDKKSYLGDDTPGDASNLHFPGFSAEAVRFLIDERGVKLIGIDTASMDYGPSHDFPVHQVVGEAGVAGLENLTGLEQLPATGAILIALPIKIEGGSGAPIRAIALVPKS
jgi:kynurenine formamidase